MEPAADSSSGAIMTSCILPGAMRRARGLPNASVNARIAVVRPPRERPMASSKAPLYGWPAPPGPLLEMSRAA